MFVRLVLLLVPFLFIACSSVERNPTCIRESDSFKERCEEQKSFPKREFNGGYRERL